MKLGEYIFQQVKFGWGWGEEFHKARPHERAREHLGYIKQTHAFIQPSSIYYNLFFKFIKVISTSIVGLGPVIKSHTLPLSQPGAPHYNVRSSKSAAETQIHAHRHPGTQ